VDANEFGARRAALAAGLAHFKLDAFFVAFSANLRYLTGFTGSNGALLVALEKSVFFTDPRYAIQASEELARGRAPRGGKCAIRVSKGPLWPEIGEAVRRGGYFRIGYEPARMTCDELESLKSVLPARSSLHPVSDWIESLRMVKSPSEIALIRKSVDLNSRAFAQATARIRAGLTEMDLAAELEYRMWRLGAEKPAFETIVASGARTALAQAQPTSARIESGRLILIDMGAMLEGYASDMTRMLFLGAPGTKVRQTYAAVLEAQQAAAAKVRAGVTAESVDRAARQVLKRHGLEGLFIHSTGHGLGLEIHESPRIGKRDKTPLKAGMAITIEPGVYLEGWGGIRIEDTVVVTETGCETLTPTPKDLTSI
jgi:Xaa-Pro aminopeptidase